MSYLDIIFRALTDYRKNTIDERDCKRNRRLIANACADSDRLEVVKTECDIDSDWIEAIETGLVFIGNAIGEERQFIRSNGEVLDIEKVKNVSKESVEHLARHSNLVTKAHEGEDLIPDKLYTVERLTDYAVYENRFLYMLLCYLRDFISYRYEKITDLTSTYNGKLLINKIIEADNRKMTFEIRIDEERKKDVFLIENNSGKDKIDRIDCILKTVSTYLSSPLMEFVAKAPMLKPPITETNVLKMNKNFKGAMQIYHFITSYATDGFSVRQNLVSLHPFEAEIADEFAEVAELCSFLTYEHGMKIEGLLRNNYNDRIEFERRAYLENERQQIQSLKRHVEETGKGAEEYMLMMERHMRLLESDSLQLAKARAEKEEAIANIEHISKNIKNITQIAEELKSQIGELTDSYKTETERINKEWEDKMHSAEERNLAENNKNKLEYSAALQKQKQEFDKKTEETALSYNRASEEFKEQSDLQIAELKEKIKSLENERKTDKIEAERRSAETERLENEKILSEAQINALKKEYGRFTESDCFTSREQFVELERQYKIFKTFFKEEWRKTKKKIRSDAFKSATKAGRTDEQSGENAKTANK